jgi:hypothetical protein
MLKILAIKFSPPFYRTIFYLRSVDRHLDSRYITRLRDQNLVSSDVTLDLGLVHCYIR